MTVLSLHTTLAEDFFAQRNDPLPHRATKQKTETEIMKRLFEDLTLFHVLPKFDVWSLALPEISNLADITGCF